MAHTTSNTLRNQVIYQVFTRNYKDGTFRALEADLPRIQALGVDILYLLPIQPSGEVHRKGSMGSPYAIKDYRAIDPVQGTMEDFISLSNAVHAAGMRLMIDVVYNHTSPDSWLAENHPEWFYHKADGSLGNRAGCWWDVVDLDYSHEGLWRYQIDTLLMWAQYVDGFRCDVAPMVPLDFWLQARDEVEEVRPGCLWLAESVEPSFIQFNRRIGVPMLSDGELYQAFDICYDYDIYHHMRDAMIGEGTLQTYLDAVNLQDGIYPANYSKLRCLENHDRSRAACMVPDEQALRNWTAWSYFAKGTTMIYAGQEFEAMRHPTLFDRDTVPFDTGHDLTPLLHRLYEVKQDHAFTDTTFHARAIGRNSSVIYAEHETNAPGDKCKAIGVFGTQGTAQALPIDLPNGTYTNELDGSSIDVFEGLFSYQGEPVIIIARGELVDVNE